MNSYRIISGIFLTIIIIISGCIHSNSKKYKDQEIGIIFKNYINESEAQLVIENYNFTIKHHTNDNPQTFIVLVPLGKEDYYLNILNNLDEIQEADRIPEDPY
jgi:hypothetical protein